MFTKSNQFLSEGLKQSAVTLSGNDALKYSTSGNDFLDQFNKLGTYKNPRGFGSISSDQHLLWSQDPELALKLTFFIRMISRKVQLMDGSYTKHVQKGAGLRHESIMRMLWVCVNDPDWFWEYISLFISVGSWKDIFTMLEYDLTLNDKPLLDHKMFYGLIAAGLHNDNTVNLLLKYLPSLKSNKQATTPRSKARVSIAKGLAKHLNIDYTLYRNLKSSGNSHDWQQKISQQKFKDINFDTIHGRALSLLVNSKFLKNQGLEQKFEKWITSKPVAKYTGYVYELMSKVENGMPNYKKVLTNKQFENLVNVGKENTNTQSGLIVVRDTSGSMNSEASGTNVSCGDIAKGLALYFSEFLDGYFTDSWIEFESTAKLHRWKGNNPVDKWLNDHSNYIGNTSFQSVINLFVDIKSKGIDESEFPKGILCISDGEFDKSSLKETNVQTALGKLRIAGFSEEYISNFKIILWNLQSNYYGSTTGEKFETYDDHKNVFYFSGYDGSIISFLMGTPDRVKPEPTNANEVFEAAMDQEVLNMITIN